MNELYNLSPKLTPHGLPSMLHAMTNGSLCHGTIHAPQNHLESSWTMILGFQKVTDDRDYTESLQRCPMKFAKNFRSISKENPLLPTLQVAH